MSRRLAHIGAPPTPPTDACPRIRARRSHGVLRRASLSASLGFLVTATLACQPINVVQGGKPLPSGGDDDDEISFSPNPSGDNEGEPDTPSLGFPDLPPGFGDPGAEGCDRVDLLFVIDNSTSMEAQQEQLLESFPIFVAHIEKYLVEENDYRVGVVTTDAYASNQPGCQTIGALVTQTELDVCGPFSGGAHMTSEDDLEEAFACAATVGTAGDQDEHHLEAALSAISPALNEDGACNEGFVRDDALLVLVIISDEDDDAAQIAGFTGSPGDPQDWIDEMVDLKGAAENVVILALVGKPEPNACGGRTLAQGGAEPGTRIREFAAAFPFHLWGDVCEANYGSFFADTLSVIRNACENFEPIP